MRSAGEIGRCGLRELSARVHAVGVRWQVRLALLRERGRGGEAEHETQRRRDHTKGASCDGNERCAASARVLGLHGQSSCEDAPLSTQKSRCLEHVEDRARSKTEVEGRVRRATLGSARPKSRALRRDFPPSFERWRLRAAALNLNDRRHRRCRARYLRSAASHRGRPLPPTCNLQCPAATDPGARSRWAPRPSVERRPARATSSPGSESTSWRRPWSASHRHEPCW